MPYFPSGGLGLPIDLTGAVAATRYVGGTATGAPVSGTFAPGDFVITQDGTVQICTVAGTPGTWAQAGGSSSNQINEIAAGVLTNATSVGDAGNRADHFQGITLGAKWTSVDISGAGVVTVGNSCYANQTTGESYITQPYTATGAFEVHMRCAVLPNPASSVDLYVTDTTSGTVISAGNALDANLFWTGGVPVCSATSTAAGTRTNRGTNQTVGGCSFVYLRLKRDGSNNCTMGYGVDRSYWQNFSASFVLAFTAARIVIRVANTVGPAVDFFDVVI